MRIICYYLNMKNMCNVIYCQNIYIVDKAKTENPIGRMEYNETLKEKIKKKLQTLHGGETTY